MKRETMIGLLKDCRDILHAIQGCYEYPSMVNYDLTKAEYVLDIIEEIIVALEDE